MAQYRDLYSGALYVIHFRQSFLLNIVYVTMMFGAGMPILFPIAAFNFMNQYICERIIVAYQVQLPPALDDKLTQNLIKMLAFSPLFMVLNGYWMLSNEQMFNNKWDWIPTYQAMMPSGHQINFNKIDYRSPILFIAIISVILTFFKMFFNKYLM
jgi:hypothetical protein